MRDWYRGPVSRKNSSTSESTRSEIGIFAAGRTGTASTQKSAGSSRSSSGDDRRISASVIRRSWAKFARPRLGLELGREDFAVRLTLTTIAHSGRNDSTDDIASLSPVGEDHSERNAISNAEGDPSYLTVILARVDALQSRAGEAQRGECEIKPSLSEVPLALLRVPVKAHQYNIRVYIRLCNDLHGRITETRSAAGHDHGCGRRA